MPTSTRRNACLAFIAALSFVVGTHACNFDHPQLLRCPSREPCDSGEDRPNAGGGGTSGTGGGHQGGGGSGGSRVGDGGDSGGDDGGSAGTGAGRCDEPCYDDEVCTDDSCNEETGCIFEPTTGGPCPGDGACVNGTCITEFPEIVTESLPEAIFRIPYAFAFEGTGGTEEGYVWELASGELPPGLSITSEGAFRGEPEREGIFSFDVRLTDSAGASARRTFRLDVKRKRWLVYHSDEAVQGQYHVYAVDVARTLDPPSDGLWKWTLTESANSYSWPPPYAFSADGRWLAYLEGTDTLRSLYVRDMSGLEPAEPRRVDNFESAATVSVVDFEWSPDSRLLAFSVSLDNHPFGLYYADFRFDPPSGPVPVNEPINTQSPYPSGSYSLDWVSNEVLTHSSDDGMSFARRDERGFYDWRSLVYSVGNDLRPIYGYVRQRWPELNVAAIDYNNDGCNGPRYLVDFRTSAADVFGYEWPIQVSPNFEYVAHWNPPLGYQIYPVWDDTPVAVIPADSYYCAPGAWSNDGRRFVSVGYEDHQLYVVMLDGSATVPVRVPGSHPPVGGLTVVRPEFSPDDKWLVFSSNLEFFLAPNSSSGIGSSLPIGLGNEAEGFAIFRFAPNSTMVAGATGPRATGVGEVFVVDLWSGAPGAPLRLLPRGDDGHVERLGWSADSTRLAFVMRDSAWPAPSGLYVINPESALGAQGSPIATEINSPPMGCPDSSCQGIPAFAFQP